MSEPDRNSRASFMARAAPFAPLLAVFLIMLLNRGVDNALRHYPVLIAAPGDAVAGPQKDASLRALVAELAAAPPQAASTPPAPARGAVDRPSLPAVDDRLLSSGASAVGLARFAGITILEGAVCLASILVALLILGSARDLLHPVKSPKLRAWGFFLVVTLGVGVVGLILWPPPNERTLEDLLSAIVLPLYPQTGAAVIRYVALADGLGFISAGCILLAMACTLAPPPPVSKDAAGAQERARYLAPQMDAQRLLLYVGTVLLISELLYTAFACQWAAACVYPPDGPAHKTVDALLTAFVTLRGVELTLILAVAYLPAASILKWYAAQAVDSILPEGERPPTYVKREEWLKERGLSASPTELIPRIAAILGPVLTGSITELLGKVS